MCGEKGISSSKSFAAAPLGFWETWQGLFAAAKADGRASPHPSYNLASYDPFYNQAALGSDAPAPSAATTDLAYEAGHWEVQRGKIA